MSHGNSSAENVLEFELAVWGIGTLGARDFSSAVSGFCQVFIVTRGFGLRSKMCRPSANTENFRRTREKPLVPRVGYRTKRWLESASRQEGERGWIIHRGQTRVIDRN